jgi:hypothetical protein
VQRARDAPPLCLLAAQRLPRAGATLELEALEHVVERLRQRGDVGLADDRHAVARAERVDAAHRRRDRRERPERAAEQHERQRRHRRQAGGEHEQLARRDRDRHGDRSEDEQQEDQEQDGDVRREDPPEERDPGESSRVAGHAPV